MEEETKDASSKPKEYFEFAELLCGRNDVPIASGGVQPMFMIRLRVHPQRGQELGEIEELPPIHMLPSQAAMLPEALHAALMRHFPMEMQQRDEERRSSESTPPSLN